MQTIVEVKAHCREVGEGIVAVVAAGEDLGKRFEGGAHSSKKRCLAAVALVAALVSVTGCVLVPVGKRAKGPDLAEAQCALGVMYAEGKDVAKDEEEAARWFELAADQGSVKAQRWLGVAYEKGQGVKKDDAEAVRWYQKAAEQGCAEAQCALGVMYAEGRGVAQDVAEAVRWYQKAAEQGCVEAQRVLGVMFAEGLGVAKDEENAVRWSRMAADKGDADAQYILGVLHEERAVLLPALVFFFPNFLHWFENVDGVAKDNAMAVFWYRKAAERGHAAAQFRLGHMFAAGRCVKEDEFSAVRWYQKAARQGNADAQKELRDRGMAW